MITYFTVPASISQSEIQHMIDGLKQKLGENFVVLRGDVRITHSPSAEVPDAICTYCTVANLSASVWCVGCGAPLTSRK